MVRRLQSVYIQRQVFYRGGDYKNAASISPAYRHITARTVLKFRQRMFTPVNSKKRSHAGSPTAIEPCHKRLHLQTVDKSDIDAVTDGLLQVMTELIEHTVHERLQMQMGMLELRLQSRIDELVRDALELMPTSRMLEPDHEQEQVVELHRAKDSCPPDKHLVFAPRAAACAAKVHLRSDDTRAMQKSYSITDIARFMQPVGSFEPRLLFPQIFAGHGFRDDVKCVYIPANMLWNRSYQTSVPLSTNWYVVPGCHAVYRQARSQNRLSGVVDHQNFVNALYSKQPVPNQDLPFCSVSRLPVEYAVSGGAEQHVAVYRASDTLAPWSSQSVFKFEGWYTIDKVSIFSRETKDLKDMLDQVLPGTRKVDLAKYLSHAWALVGLRFSLQADCPCKP